MNIKKMEIKEEPNPIGEVYIIDTVEKQIEALQFHWDELNVDVEKSSWWKFWNWGKRTSLTKVTDFLIKALDDFIHMVDNTLTNGPDKKATVLDAISRLYDYVIREALPIWLKPFAGRVKNYIINELVSVAIDWIVDKYRNGSWREKWEDIAHGGDEDDQTTKGTEEENRPEAQM